MEFMAGGSLEKFLHQSIKDPAIPSTTFGIGNFDPQWRTRIQLALDIARGVRAMHMHDPPIIHRDINSRNILVSLKTDDFSFSIFMDLLKLTANGRAKIADLGTATVLPFKHLEFHKTITELRWMPPEIMFVFLLPFIL